MFTTHAEIEGMAKLKWFHQFLIAAQKRGIRFATLHDVAIELLTHRDRIPVCDMGFGTVDGRSGTLAVQQNLVQEPRA